MGDLLGDAPETLSVLLLSLRVADLPWKMDLARMAIYKAPGGAEIERACLAKGWAFSEHNVQRLFAEIGIAQGKTLPDFLPLTPAAAAAYLKTQPEVEAQPSSGTGRKTPQPTVNGRMLQAVQEDHTRAEWTAARWANYLGCSASAVVGTKTWATYSTFREMARAKRAEKAYKNGLEVKADKRRLPKRKRRRHSSDD